HSGVSPLVGFGVLQQQINLIRRFFSNVQTPDSVITQTKPALTPSSLAIFAMVIPVECIDTIFVFV
ncbi:MAG TPA: hypothetical protein QGG18_02980, partial [Rhodospirillales bacterium]|nr:hypothetical protein [Rhodospirillales bacterium]